MKRARVQLSITRFKWFGLKFRVYWSRKKWKALTKFDTMIHLTFLHYLPFLKKKKKFDTIISLLGENCMDAFLRMEVELVF